MMLEHIKFTILSYRTHQKMKDTNRDNLTVVMHPLQGDDAYLTAGEFVKSLSAFRDTFIKLCDSEVSIVGLSINSPITVMFGEPENVGGILGGFYDGLAEVTETKEAPLHWSRAIIDEVSTILKPIGKGIAKYEVACGDDKLLLDISYKAKFAEIIKADQVSDGTIDGMLEAVNIHGGKNVLTLYPEVGQTKVSCHFPDEKLDAIKKFIGKYVEIHGRLKHKWREKYPHEVRVEHIEVIDEDNLPSFSDLMGLAPNATHGLPSEDFIASIRSEWI